MVNGRGPLHELQDLDRNFDFYARQLCPTYSHARPSDTSFPARALGRLTVLLRPGYKGVVSALSVPTYRGWVPTVETAEIEKAMRS